MVRPSVAARLGAFANAQVLVSSAPNPAGSLAVAVRGAAIAQDALVLVTPVDAAPASLATIEALVAALTETPLALAATPRHGGKGATPSSATRRCSPRTGGGRPPPLRDVLRSLGGRRLRVDVDDARVLVDLDTPDDVLAWTGHAPGFAWEDDMTTDCTFCKIIAGDIPALRVLEDDVSIAFLDTRPLFPGHTLLVPHVHYETLPDLPPELLAPLFANAQRLARAMVTGLEAPRELRGHEQQGLPERAAPPHPRRATKDQGRAQGLLLAAPRVQGRRRGR